MLDGALEKLGALVLCPQVLAETSNLLGFRQSLGQQARWRDSLADLVSLAEEQTITSKEAVRDSAFLALGLTDAVLVMLSHLHALTLISADLALCLEAESRALPHVNFSYLQDGAIRVDQL